jgi:hypothetical protein
VAPVTCTISIFEELKLRLGVKTDEEVIQNLRRYKNIKEQPERYEISADDKGNVTLIEDIFQNEPVTLYPLLEITFLILIFLCSLLSWWTLRRFLTGESKVVRHTTFLRL